jgi:hypothetical protein
MRAARNAGRARWPDTPKGNEIKHFSAPRCTAPKTTLLSGFGRVDKKIRAKRKGAGKRGRERGAVDWVHCVHLARPTPSWLPRMACLLVRSSACTQGPPDGAARSNLLPPSCHTPPTIKACRGRREWHRMIARAIRCCCFWLLVDLLFAHTGFLVSRQQWARHPVTLSVHTAAIRRAVGASCCPVLDPSPSISIERVERVKRSIRGKRP